MQTLKKNTVMKDKQTCSENPSFAVREMGENPKQRARYGVADDSIPPFFNLHEDISMYVFSKLPVNSILRCRCVCKQWRRLFSLSDFVTMHLKYSPSPHKFILRSNKHHQCCYIVDYEESDKGNCKRRDFPLKSRDSSVVLGSSNGLLCVSINHAKKGDPDNHKIVLWNPSTGDYKILPNPNPIIDTSDLSGNLVLVGFAFDSFSGDYKLVRAIFRRANFQVDVYSLKSNSWKVIESAALNKFAYSLHDNSSFCLDIGGVTVNGSIYWRIHREHTNDYNWIVGFDLKDEIFTELQFPPIDVQGFLFSNAKLRVMGGCLGVYCIYWTGGSKDDYVVVLWIMRKEGEKNEWTKLMYMSCCEMGRVGWHFINGLPICCFENGKVIFYVATFDSEIGRVVLVVYDPKLNVVGTLPFYGISNCRNFVRRIWYPTLAYCEELVMYTETLVSPNAWVA